MSTKSVENQYSGLSFSQKISLVATSVSAFAALPITAQADIIHFDMSHSFAVNIGGNDVEWDIDNDGTVDFDLANNKSSYMTQSSYGLGTGGAGLITVYRTTAELSGRGNNELVFDAGPPAKLANLPASALIENNIGSPYDLRNGADLLLDRPDGFFNGNELGGDASDFTDGEDGLIGFSFQDTNSDQLAGWARINIDVDDGSVTVKEWAYESTAGAGIRASAVPLPGALPLMLLGLGALGVTNWRSRRKPLQASRANT